MSAKRKQSMYVMLECSCEAHLELDVVPGDEAGAWALVHRFVNAHVKCDYATPLAGAPAQSSAAPDDWPGTALA